jgi:3-hydroxyacyl-CoA dehydrogenase
VEIKIIAVIGADIVGREIACLAALAGYRVILEDVSDDRLGKAANWILEKLESCVVYNPVPARFPRDASESLLLAHTVEDAIRDADLVIDRKRPPGCAHAQGAPPIVRSFRHGI